MIQLFIYFFVPLYPLFFFLLWGNESLALKNLIRRLVAHLVPIFRSPRVHCGSCVYRVQSSNANTFINSKYMIMCLME